MGFARSKKQIFDIVDRVLESKGKNVKVSNGWWQSFRNRHPTYQKLFRVYETILNLRINGYFPKTTGFMAINLGTAFIITLFILIKSYNLPRDCF